MPAAPSSRTKHCLFWLEELKLQHFALCVIEGLYQYLEGIYLMLLCSFSQFDMYIP